MSKPNATPRRVRVEPGVYRRPDEKFEIGWRDATGRQKWRRVDGGIKAARAALAVEHSKRHRGERTSTNPRMNFEQAVDLWWDARVVNLRPATQSAYAASLKHVMPVFGRRRLTDITAGDIASFISAQAGERKGWTVKGQLTVLSSVFKYASRHLGYVGINPVSQLDKHERPSTDDESPKRILTAAELRRLLDKTDVAYRLLFELAAETGARLGEVLGVTWECIDLDGASVHFTQQLDRKGAFVALKTKRSRRWVEVTPALVHKLCAHKLASSASSDHDLVFVNRAGKGHDHRNVGGRVLARAVERAELGAIKRDDVVIVPAPTFHDLRHSHASALIAAGWDIEEVSSRLGHADTAITQRTYVHAFDQARRSEDRRRRLTSLYAPGVEASVEATDPSSAQQAGTDESGKVRPLRATGT